MMNTKLSTTILTVSTLMLFSLAALAHTETQKPMQHDMAKMDMTSMMNEPHHALAMAYMQNIGAFAKALHSQAEGTVPINAKFAREAVSEMTRSFGHMEEHHADHMKAMNEEMRSHMAAMMKDIQATRSMLKEAISALEKDVRVDPPSSSQVAAGSAKVIKHLDEMSKMHVD